MSSMQGNFEEAGFDENRFEGEVRRDLICGICHDVLRNPRICQNKEHPFCLSCITRYLQISPTCPTCREHLTPETLKRPPRFLTNCLAELKIKCNYITRGCPGFVQLDNLENHVAQCGFAPVTCTNEGCGMEINRRDKDHHEKNFCQHRIAKCQDCRDMKAGQDEMNARQDEMKVEIHQMKATQDQMKVDLDEVKRNINEMKIKQDQMEARECKLQSSVDEMKKSQAEMKAETRQQYEKLIEVTELINQKLQGANVNNNGAQALDPPAPVHSAINQVIMVIGGRLGPGSSLALNTAEEFNLVDGKSSQLPPMNHPRSQVASCVYNNDVIVAGGFDSQDGTDTMEILNINQHPLRWRLFNGKLPVKLCGHDVIVYQDKLISIGGHNWNENKASNAIYETRLTPPYTSKLLARMPQARVYHRAELVNGKLFILGGGTTIFGKKAIDSVVVYDFFKNECKPCASLPRPVCGMSTVTWGSMVILIGGVDKNNLTLNDVIVYDTETGRSEKLPSMIHKRLRCSAVIVNDVIVVFGGWNGEQGALKSVESFTIGSDGWKELTEMREIIYDATAVVKPRN